MRIATLTRQNILRRCQMQFTVCVAIRRCKALAVSCVIVGGRAAAGQDLKFYASKINVARFSGGDVSMQWSCIEKKKVGSTDNHSLFTFYRFRTTDHPRFHTGVRRKNEIISRMARPRRHSAIAFLAVEKRERGRQTNGVENLRRPAVPATVE